MTLFDQMFLASELRARTASAEATPADVRAHVVREPLESNAVMETPGQTRQPLVQIDRGLGAYAARTTSEHDHRLALERQLRRG